MNQVAEMLGQTRVVDASNMFPTTTAATTSSGTTKNNISNHIALLQEDAEAYAAWMDGMSKLRELKGRVLRTKVEEIANEDAFVSRMEALTLTFCVDRSAGDTKLGSKFFY